jgi:hypothetical protein
MPTTHTTPIDLRGFHGREFEGVINDHDNNDVICKGKICIDKLGDVYLCQNKAKGIRTEDTLGFDYSWIAQESNESLWSTPSVKSITILDPPSSIDPRWDWKDGEEVAYDDEERKRCRVITDNIVAFICDEGTKAEAITAQMTFREAYEHGYRKLPSPPSRKLTEMTQEISRRNRLDQNFPSEKLIYEAMISIEQLDANIKLTDAITHLQKAKDLLADYFDEVERKRNIPGSLYRNHPLDNF